jgi:hypothetical protein
VFAAPPTHLLMRVSISLVLTTARAKYQFFSDNVAIPTAWPATVCDPGAARRKAFTPSEMVELGRPIEALEKPKAKERQREGREKGGKEGGRGRPKPNSSRGNSPEPNQPATNNQPATPLADPPPPKPKPNGEAGRTAAAAAEAAGVDRRTYEKARAVTEKAAADPACWSPLPGWWAGAGVVGGFRLTG